MSFVTHTAMYYGVKRKKMEYFLPWLVVVILFLITGPFIMVWKYFEHIEVEGEEWLAIFIVAAGYPWCKYKCQSNQKLTEQLSSSALT